MPKQRIFLNFTEGFLRFELAQNILQPVKGQGINELTGVSNPCKVDAWGAFNDYVDKKRW